MSLTGWLQRSLARVRHRPREGARESVSEFARGLARRVDPHVPGVDVFDRPWDAMVVLDACRPDLLASVASSYEFLPARPDRVTSNASGTWLWMERNFDPAYAAELSATTYVTANPYSDEYVDAGAFDALVEVWREGWDDDLGTVPARAVTDAAVRVARERDVDRLLVHYMQPHFPSVPRPLAAGIDLDEYGAGWRSVWDEFAAGRLSREEVWAAYRANLEYVLDDVALLLRNLDAERVVVTADHGNALGRFGVHGHPPYVPLPSLRRVPWVETTARDHGGYQPPAQSPAGQTDEDADGDGHGHVDADRDGSGEGDESGEGSGDAGEVTTDEVRSRLEALGYR